MAGIKIDPEMLDIYMELLNKLMAGSETDGGNARLEVSGAGKTEDGLVRYNEEVNKLGDDLRELYGNEGEILGRIRDGTLFKNADKVSVVARSTDDAGVLAKHADEAAAWLHGGKVFRYSDETAEAVASGEKLLKESGTIYESFADMMSPEDAKRYLDFLENGSREGLTGAELAGVEKADALLVSQKVEYDDVWDLRNVGDLLESGSKGGSGSFGIYSTKIDNKVRVIDKQELPSWLGKTFKDGNYRTVVTNEEIIVYRSFGHNAEAGGAFATSSPALNRVQTKIDSAILPEWKNTLRYEAEIVIPKGTTLNIGRVEEQFTMSGARLAGDADQFLLPENWDLNWIKSIREVKP